MKIARLASLLCTFLLFSIPTFGSTLTWTGAGGNGLWSNPANWAGGIAPKNGDALVFGAESTTNDLTGLSLSSITVTSGTPHFGGNAAAVDVVQVSGGSLLSTNFPLNAGVRSVVQGGKLKLEACATGSVTVSSGTLEVTSEHGVSQIQGLTMSPSSQFVVDSWNPNGGLAAGPESRAT